MSNRNTTQTDVHDVSRRLRVVRLIQDYYLESDAYWQLPEIFEMILRSLDDVLGFKHSLIYLLNEDGQALMFQSSYGYSEDHINSPIKVGQGFIGMCAQSGEVMRIGDLGKGFRYMKAIRTSMGATLSQNSGNARRTAPGLSSLESHMSVPLKTKSGVIGVIVVESHERGAFDEIDQELLLLIAGQTARLVEEARRSEENKRRQEGLLHAKHNLHQLNTFLDSVITASSMEDSPTYTGAMMKQMRGFHYMSSEAEKATSYFEQAADIFYEIGMLLEAVKSKLGSAVLAYPDRPDQAYSLLQECLSGFTKSEASKYIELTKSIISSLEPTDRGLRQLTKREREVAVLAYQGLANAEIADKLVVSLRTVTTHMERIYSKLEVRSRAELSRYIKCSES